MSGLSEIRVQGTLGDELVMTMWRSLADKSIVVRFRTYDHNLDEDPTGEIDVALKDLRPLVAALDLAAARWTK